MKKKFTILIIFSVLLAVQLNGCGSTNNNLNWNSGCRISLDDLPPEYSLLSKEIRDDIQISVSFSGTSTDKKYSTILTDANNYSQTLDMQPGIYRMFVYVSGQNLCMFDVVGNTETIEISNSSFAEISLHLADKDKFVSAMESLKPTSSILECDIFSRQVQYQGEIVDLTKIQEIMTFPIEKQTEYLKPGETCTVVSTSHAGVALIIQNQNTTRCTASEGTIVGVRFWFNEIVFPKGIALGTELSEIAHANTGVLGTPTYCLGSPLLQFSDTRTTLVYLDRNTGDRVSFEIVKGETYVGAIVYEFERYE